ncbi:hypothetical protein [Kineosporia babensis]|uniref:Uncharacterized protein n=1 Tax=Kineosporia babensis TaxID=499548 RepID=A0A9X1NMT8_9ACTN|nr:hypothetical protein [Kineosporia babensis]MCD5317063.1 hypothetical protein [Kineosporia babensis]
MLELIHNMDISRTRHMVAFPRPGSLGILIHLFWPDGKDLIELDARVAAGIASDEDFMGAIPVERASMLCQNCLVKFDLLKWQDGNSIFRTESLEWIAGQEGGDSCPNCGHRLGMRTVHIFFWASRDLSLVPSP